MYNFIDIAYAAETSSVADQGVAASLGINLQLFIFQLINFAVVACIIWFLILKPLLKKMAERQEIIDQSLRNAKKIEDTVARSEKDYKEKIAMARAEANKVINIATEDAKKVGEELKKKTKEEIEKLVEQTKKNIKLEKEEMVAGIKLEVADLVVAAMEKVLSEKMNSEKDRKLIEESLKKLSV